MATVAKVVGIRHVNVGLPVESPVEHLACWWCSEVLAAPVPGTLATVQLVTVSA